MSASEFELLARLWPLLVSAMFAAVLIYLLGYWNGSRERKTVIWDRQAEEMEERYRRNRTEFAAMMALADESMAATVPATGSEPAPELAIEPVVAGSDLPPRDDGVADATRILAPVVAAMDALAEHGQPKTAEVEPRVAPPPPIRLDVDDALDVEPTPDDDDEVPQDETRVTSLGRSDGDTDMHPPVEVAAHRYAWPAAAFTDRPEGPVGPPVDRGVFPRGWGWMRRQAWRPARALRTAVDVQVARRRELRRQRELPRPESVPHVGWQPGELATVTGQQLALVMPSPRLAAGAGVHTRRRIAREKRERVQADTQSWTMPAQLRLAPGWKAALAPPRTLAGAR